MFLVVMAKPPCTCLWAISSSEAARTSLTTALKRSAKPTRGWFAVEQHHGALDLHHVVDLGRWPWSLVPRSWLPFTPAGNRPWEWCA